MSKDIIEEMKRAIREINNNPETKKRELDERILQITKGRDKQWVKTIQ